MRRPLPLEAAFNLGLHAQEPGFVQFLVDCRDDGFALEYPSDEDLPDDEWRETVIMRVRVLCNAWKTYSERQGA